MFNKCLDYYYGNILISDNVGKILYVNETLLKMYGPTRERALSMSVYDFIKEGILDKSAVIEALKTGKSAFIKLCVNSGVMIDCVAKPVYGSDGEVEYIIAISYDETFMREMQRQLSIEKARTEEFKDKLLFIQQANNKYRSIITADKQMKNIFRSLKYLAASDSSIILYGESGVGKDVLANYIHNNSIRKDEIFMPVNCGAIPSELMEAEFFGYEKGAFTGADRRGKKGIFEMGNGGTVFLDEIGDLPLFMQAKLLRFLDSGEIKRIGSTKIIYSDVRILAATNKDLKQLVKEGKFREELYYRLNIIPIFIPPLRERPDDIKAISEYYLKEFNQKYNRNIGFSKEQKERLNSYSWPGNIRELRNEIERYVIINGDKNILSDRIINKECLSDNTKKSKCTKDLRSAKEEFEKEYIKSVLIDCGWKIQKTADKLGIHRSVLYSKIEKYKLRQNNK
jgi:transcriptional regulator with PAS, ATPase and Fis domain